jgi:hypothetical protein
MHSSLLLFGVLLLSQLVSAFDIPELVPVSDAGWFGNVRKRDNKDLLRLLDSEHMVWNSAAGKNTSAHFK